MILPYSRCEDIRRTLLSTWLLNLLGKSDTNQSEMGLEFLQCLRRIVDESETSCLSTTELCLETEDVDLVLGGLVEFCELATEFIFGDVGSVWVEDITISSLLEADSSILSALHLHFHFHRHSPYLRIQQALLT